MNILIPAEELQKELNRTDSSKCLFSSLKNSGYECMEVAPDKESDGSNFWINLHYEGDKT